MDIQQIKYFSRVYEMRSFTQAADSLFISRQALRKSVARPGNGGAAVREPRQRALPHGGGRSAVQHLASGVECVRANGGRVEPRQAKEPRDRAFWAIGGGKRRYDLGRDEAGHRLFLDKRARDQGNVLHRSKLRGAAPTNP